MLVHGFGASGWSMIPLAQTLASSFSVYVPDLPGHGRSRPLPGAAGIPELSRSLADWLDAVDLARPAFVASSMGCQVVTDLVVRQPSRVGSLVLVGPTVDPRQRSAPRQLAAAIREINREPISLVASAIQFERSTPRALLATARSALADRIENRLPLIEAPTAVVRGANDCFVSDRWSAEVALRLRRGSLVVIPREAHAVHYTRPDIVAEVVEQVTGQRPQRRQRPPESRRRQQAQ